MPRADVSGDGNLSKNADSATISMIFTFFLDICNVYMPLCHTLHLYEPLGTADGGINDGTGDVGIDVGHHAIDEVIIGEITQIDNEIHDVVHRGSTVGKEGSDVLKQTGCLLADVAKIKHLSLVVDTGSAGDII